MQGLTIEQVAAARKQFGANELASRKRKSFMKSFLANFGDPMIRVLVVALGIQIVFLFGSANAIETFGIAAAILVAVIISSVSEYGSERAFEKLQAVALNIECRVRRAGKTVVVPIVDIVVGDIVLLGAGDKIPADGIIVSGNIEVDQSLLNGESKEAKKIVQVGKAGGREGGKIDFLSPLHLFSGTVVTGGEAVMRVTAVGHGTVYGKIAAELQEDTPKSPLKFKLEKLAKMISVIGYVGAGLVAFSYMFSVFVLQGNSFNFVHVINATTLVVSVIVMAVPEGLPMMITVVLSSNMKNMLRDNVLIRKLNGIETAGSMNILFTDKTGTLTRGKLEVVGFVDGGGRFYEKVRGEEAGLLSLGLRFNTSAEMSRGRAVGGNSTDRILLEYAQGLPEVFAEVISTVPFSSAAKFMSSVLSDGRVLFKGAPEKIISQCAGVEDREALYKKIEELSGQSIRLIAVAIDDRLIGLVAIRDRVRGEAMESIVRLKSAGIQTVMITGDAVSTATAVAKEVGIWEKGCVVITSDELCAMTDGTVAEILPRLRVVARALPSDKSRLVRIAQGLNLVVGMTGDGVNDAPALKKADIGFAMGSGTEVAKEAGDIVIMDDNINSIARAVSYGRTIFKSIRKFLIFKLTINFCAMATCIIAPLLSIDTPITVIQMLWINLVMDTLAGLAYGGEKPRAKYMTEPPKRRDEPIINRFMWNQIIVTSIFTAGLSIWFLLSPWVHRHFDVKGDRYAMTAFFMFFMFMNIFNSFNTRTHEINPLSYISLNKIFVFIMGAVSVVQIGMVYMGGSIFRTVGLNFFDFVFVMILAFTVIPFDMLRKLFVSREHRLQGT